MWETIFAIGGLTIGSIVATVVVSSRSKLRAQETQTDLKSQLAGLESAAVELRQQRQQLEQSVQTLQTQLGEEQRELAKSQTQLAESSSRLEEQKKTLADTVLILKDTFKALSAEALQTNAEEFLQSAKKTLQLVLTDARGDLGKREEAIKTLVQPIADSLKRYEEQMKTVESVRQKEYGSLTEQVKLLASTSQQLQQETGKLVTSLRDPKVRGNWGELALKQAVELAGMSEHCDFEQQVTINTDDAQFRPDMIVHLPGGRRVVVDAKAVLDAYLDAVAATNETARDEHLKRHASQVRSRVRELASKSYWDKLPQTPEFVVLFLPAESFFSAAIIADHKLVEDAMKNRVILASPTTLIALLRAIAFGWRQEQVAANAEKISLLGKELFDRMRTLAEHFDKVGKNLSRTVDDYNKAVGSLETRVLPSARRFKELGAAAGDDITELTTIDRSPRGLELTTGQDASDDYNAAV